MRYGEPNRIQAEILFCALGVGFILGVMYAGWMLLRVCIRHSATAVAVEDVVYCIAAAIITFLFLMDYNSGAVRFYLLSAECLSFLAVRTAALKIVSKLQKKTCKKRRR